MWYGNAYPYGMGYDGGWWGMAFHGIFAVVFWVLVLAALVLVVRWLWHRGAATGGDGRARAILDERYARGEIDREEYLARRRDLS